MHLHCLLFLFLGITTSLFAQSKPSMSLATLNELDSLTVVYYRQGNYSKALECAQKCIKQTSTLEYGEERYILNLTDIGVLHLSLGNYEAAEPLLMKVVELTKATYGEINSDYLLSLNNLADLYKKLNKFDESEQLFLQALTIAEKLNGKENQYYAIVANNLGALYYNQGRYNESIKSFLEAKSINKKISPPNDLKYIANNNNIAALYLLVGKTQKAIGIYEETLDAYEKIVGTNHIAYSTNLANYAAAISQDSATRRQSKALYLKVLQIEEAVTGKHNPNYFGTLSSIGLVCSQLGESEEALGYFQQGLAINTKNPNFDLNNLESLPNASFMSRSKSLFLFENLTNHYEQEYWKTKNPDFLKKEQEVIDVAIKVSHKVREEFTTEKDKLYSLRKIKSLLDQGLKNLALLSSIYPDDSQYAQKAFQFAEQNKSILLNENLKGQQVSNLGYLPDSLLQEEYALQKRFSALKRKESQSSSKKEKAAIAKDLSALLIEINTFKRFLKKDYPQYYQLKYQNTVPSQTSIQNLLDSETALVEYFVSHSVVYCFFITQDNLEFTSIPVKRDTLNQKIKLLRQALSDHSFILKNPNKTFDNFTQGAHWFYKMFVPKQLKSKSIKNIVVVTDGNLGHLPFEIFLQKPVNQSVESYTELPYLINDYNISYAYSANLWQQLKSNSNTSLAANGQMLAFAAAYPKLDSSKLQALRTPSNTALRLKLSPLSAAKAEVQHLSQYFKGQFVDGLNANEAFFKEHASQYSVIHLAMHGILNERLPILSALAFSENLDSLEDNFLQAYEIAQLKLSNQLVVLSACETGFGKYQQGEGVLSLARSFMYAGVPSLVVSLWQINDQSTAILMELFYQNLAQGMNKDAALRQAKLSYLKSATDIAAHPALWSPLIQLGDNSPIQLHAQSTGLIWKIGLGILIFLVGLGWFFKSRQSTI